MRVGVYMSTLGCSPLRVGLMRGLVALGHYAEEYNPGNEYELVLVHNHVAHVQNYTYPDFPNNVLGDPQQKEVQLLRAGMAAGAVLESLAVLGFTLKEPEEKA